MDSSFVQSEGRGRLARLVLLLAAIGVAAVAVAAVMIRAAPDETGRWHVDPLSAERTGKPNDYLVLPEGMNGDADATMPLGPVPALALMERFEAVALSSPRVTRIAGGPQLLFATYVQRSAIFGFPDYISVRAVQAEDGAALAIWSRSRYGHSDLGVNRRRIEGWLEALGAAEPPDK
jgi:uncharacterized protein (DUF1499 family)